MESSSANTNRFSPGARSLLATKARRLRTMGVARSTGVGEELPLQAMAKKAMAKEARAVLLRVRVVGIRAIELAPACRWVYTSLMQKTP